MDKTNVALIGCGYWGKNHLKTLSELDEVDVSYVCDFKNPSIKVPLGVKFVGDYNQIINDSNVNGIVLATPTASHYDIAKEFLMAGKNVLVEKPLTTKVSEAKELCDLAESKNLCLMVGEIFRFNPAVKYIKGVIEKGDIGEMRYIESRRVGLGPIRNDVSSLWDLATHDIYISNLFVGKNPSGVSCSGMSHNGKLDDITSLNLRYESPNVLSTIYVNWEHPIKERLMIVGGTKKALSFNDMEPSEKVAIYERTVDYLPQTGDFGEFQSSIRSGDILIPNMRIKAPLEEELRHFIHCMTKKERCISDGYAGLDTVRVLEAAEQSKQSGGIEVLLK